MKTIYCRKKEKRKEFNYSSPPLLRLFNYIQSALLFDILSFLKV